MSTYLERLRAASKARDSLLCVGLDPEPEAIPGGLQAAVDVCRKVVEATADVACCYKPNAAFWEQYGPDGWRGLVSVKEAIPDETPVLFDAKRADLGRTMRAYAHAIFEELGMDAVTVHAYHGSDSLAEFVRYGDRGVYVVCHTSNPGRVDLQHLAAPERPLYMEVAALADRMNENGNVGLVTGATAPEEIKILREAFPELPFLLPGVGRQGGDVSASVAAAYNGDPASCLVAVSGGILRAEDPRAAAISFRDEISTALPA
jgi:orotidine 5'-phosphate decarboxylase subfamily 2